MVEYANIYINFCRTKKLGNRFALWALPPFHILYPVLPMLPKRWSELDGRQ